MNGLKKELKKSVINPFFICPLIILTVLSIINAASNINEYNMLKKGILTDEIMSYNPGIPIMTTFNMWLGTRKSNNITDLFFVLALAFSILPYTWSHRYEIRRKKTDAELGIKQYYNKLIAVFITSGAIIAIPMIINFISVSLFIPSRKPDSIYDIYYGIFSSDLMGNYFYSSPMLYIFVYVLICFALCGAIGGMTYALSTIIENWILASAVPVAFILLFRFNDSAKALFETEISPINLLNSAPEAFIKFKYIAIEFVFMLAIIIFSCIGTMMKKTKRD